MNLEELLKLEEPNTRVDAGNKWLYWDYEWVVLEHKYAAKSNITRYKGESLDKAIEELLK